MKPRTRGEEYSSIGLGLSICSRLIPKSRVVTWIQRSIQFSYISSLGEDKYEPTNGEA